MRYPYLLVLLLALNWPLAVQAQQPFAKLGVQVEILSLTHGRFPEFFANDSLRRIGSVVYDTYLGRVAYLLPPDSLEGRMESEITSRWVSPDPLAEEDAHLSPYVFCANNAVRYKDPDGRKVIYGEGATAEFKRDFAAAVKYLNAHGAAGNLAALQASKETYYIGSQVSGKGPHFDPQKRTIAWNTHDGALNSSKGKIHISSPAALLNHEIDHANEFDKNPKQFYKDGATPDAQYGNKEEKRVITGSEQETAHKLGEVPAGETTRTDHFTSLLPMTGPTSTEIADMGSATGQKPQPAPQPTPQPKPKEKQE